MKKFENKISTIVDWILTEKCNLNRYYCLQNTNIRKAKCEPINNKQWGCNECKIPNDIFALFASDIFSGVSALFGWGFSGGFGVGVIIGLVLYGVYWMMRMCSDDYTLTGFSDGNQEKEYESFKGIVSLIVMIICRILQAVNYFD